MCNTNNYFKKNFAEFIASYDEESYKVHFEKKTELFSQVQGKVLEIGPGTGVNFPFLKNKVIEWMGLEPNNAMHPYLFNTANDNNINARILDCSIEHICLPDNSIDFIISSEVLCSLDHLKASLEELWRVLKPGGKFLFLEHVVDKNNLIRRTIQKMVPYTPWKYYSDGCRPGRDIAKAIKSIGFSKVKYIEYMREGKGIIITINRPHIYGWATK